MKQTHKKMNWHFKKAPTKINKQKKNATTIVTATTTKRERKREFPSVHPNVPFPGQLIDRTLVNISRYTTTKSYLLSTLASDWFLASYIINFPSLPFRRFLSGFLTATFSQTFFHPVTRCWLPIRGVCGCTYRSLSLEVPFYRLWHSHW